MYKNLKSDRRAGRRPTSLPSRRQMLRLTFFGALIPLAMPASLLALAVDNPSRDFGFGPEYTVLQVRNNLQGIQVLLEFQVNGRSFTTQLKSVDGHVWRPV